MQTRLALLDNQKPLWNQSNHYTLGRFILSAGVEVTASSAGSAGGVSGLGMPNSARSLSCSILRDEVSVMYRMAAQIEKSGSLKFFAGEQKRMGLSLSFSSGTKTTRNTRNLWPLKRMHHRVCSGVLAACEESCRALAELQQT